MIHQLLVHTGRSLFHLKHITSRWQTWTKTFARVGLFQCKYTAQLLSGACVPHGKIWANVPAQHTQWTDAFIHYMCWQYDDAAFLPTLRKRCAGNSLIVCPCVCLCLWVSGCHTPVLYQNGKTYVVWRKQRHVTLIHLALLKWRSAT